MGILCLGAAGDTPHASEHIGSGIIVMPPCCTACAGFSTTSQGDGILLHILGMHAALVQACFAENEQIH